MKNRTGTALTEYFEASLAVLKQCVERCPGEHRESKVAELTVRQIAYHTLFFVDFYLTASENAFQRRDLHRIGGDESQPLISPGLDRETTLEYLAICHEKLLVTIASES